MNNHGKLTRIDPPSPYGRQFRCERCQAVGLIGQLYEVDCIEARTEADELVDDRLSSGGERP